VPCDFRAVDEGYRFILPGAKIHGYFAGSPLSVDELASRYDLFAVQLPLQTPCDGCKIIGERLEIRGRHSPDELKRILAGDVFEQLFVKELLIESSGVSSVAAKEEGCR